MEHSDSYHLQSLQIFLTMCSPLRKRMNNTLIKIFIWLAYLMADSTAFFCVGHIASSQVSSNKINTQNHLLAFWAPFLLVHLGGPDTITAFSLEDNQLWKRHMLGFITQFLFCAYVFLLTVPGNKLWIPTVLVFVAGIIKYGERIYAMYHATTPIESNQNQWVLIPLGRDLSQVQVVKKAIHFQSKIMFNQTLGPVDMISSLRVIEVVMNFYYDEFFNKFSLSYGYLCRFVTISCLLIVLGLFLFEEKQYKQGFNPFDITVTYILICGALALDIIALLMHFFSDRVILFFPTIADFSFMRSILELRRTRWSKCKKKPYTKFTQLSTLLPFRRWSESISGFNMISYSRYTMRKQSSWLHYFDMFSGGTIFMRLNEVKNPFLLELWEFIFEEIQDEHSPSSPFNGVVQDISTISVRDTAFSMIVITWHIATHLCYVQKSDNEVDKREFSKLLSDYMMYLLVFQSDMIPHAEAYTSEIKKMLDELQANFKPYFNNGDEDEIEACKGLVAEHAGRDERDKFLNLLVPNSNLCIGACMLAKEMGVMSAASIDWGFISMVWVGILLHAARECNFSIHVPHLSKGGELISFVRMLDLMTNPSIP